MSDFINTIKRITLSTIDESKPMQICFGIVKSVEPLVIYVDQKLFLDESKLLLTKNVSAFNTYTSSDNAVSVVGDVASYATSFVGKIPYYYGGGRNYTTLEDIVAANGMCDCSAFTERVFRHFGIEIGTTTYEQVNAGTKIDLADVKSGDLLLFNNHSSGAQPGHVGIYIGDGKVVHEGGGNYSGNVKIGALSSFDVMYVRRINVSISSTQFPQYSLSDNAIKDIATCITGETGGDDVTACRQEASQMANLNEVYYKRSATEANIINTLHGGWYATSSWSRGCTQNSIDAVKYCLIDGKRVLPRYVTEHDTFPLDVVNAKSRSDYSKGDSVNNKYGSSYKFYCFFGSNGNGDISGYFQKDYEKYKNDTPWTNDMITGFATANNNSVAIHNGLVVGDSVILLRVQGGQKFVVMDTLLT